MLRKIIKVFSFLVLCFLMSCEDPHFPVGSVQGYKPIYAANSMISFESPQAVIKPGKIIRYENYLLINELQAGIHFFDNSDPTTPVAIGFLKIENNTDMAVKDDVLYVDHNNSLVGLQILDLNDIKELSRLTIWSQIVPPQSHHYFECVDLQKEVIGWSLENLNDPKCYH